MIIFFQGTLIVPFLFIILIFFIMLVEVIKYIVMNLITKNRKKVII
ncbi:phage shock protein PspC (stress-responsive transcriptional regulator) [Marinitoga litoralis]|nr:phage shock protein PspC (stress-responsive transcriptional regulator) [Marinitoga litoralis]